ncbi:MAG: CoB--CoM heterodisulfide reductase iron-sulfur subunit B family protein [Pseudomonadota bacterium]
MKFTLFIGCNIPARVQQYELSARAVSEKLGIELIDDQEFKCCGNPIRNTDNQTFILMAARNLALAEKQGLDIMVLCKCCFGSLKKAAHFLKQHPLIQEQVNTELAKENLNYSGTGKIKHFLSVLYHDIGIKTIKGAIVKPFTKLNIATHYGCHALRPSDVTQFDNPVAPVLFDELVNVTGAKSIDWPLKLECCGAPMLGVADTLSMDLTEKKLADGLRAGANYLCVACPYCQMQFDRVQPKIPSHDEKSTLSSIVFPQLLGIAMGLSGNEVGISQNVLDISNIESFIKQEEKKE